MRVLSRPWATLVVVLALLGPMLLTTPAQAAGTGSVVGKVLATIDGVTAPQEGAYVGLTPVDAEGQSLGAEVGVWTGTDGSFSVLGLENGTYKARILPSPEGREVGGLGYEYYDDKWSPYDPTLITVSGGQVALPDITLQQVGWITGTVRDAQGTPLPNIWVSVSDSAMSGGYSVQTDANGRYDSRTGDYTGNTIPGSYQVEASVFTGQGEQAYDRALATVQVSAKQGATQDLVIQPLQTAVFTVLDTDGSPLRRAPLELLLQRTPGGPWEAPQSGPIETDDEGHVRVTEGINYKIRFLLPQGYVGTAVPEYWDGPEGAGSSAPEDAAVLSWEGEPLMRRFTVQLEAPAVTASTPTITGTAQVGQTLTAIPGTWGPGDVDLTYTWKAGGAIVGSDQPTYRPTDADLGKTITVTVTGTKTGHTSTTRTSTPTAAVTAAPVEEIQTGEVTISGTPRAGKILTADPGTWTPSEVELTYAWLADGVVIAGAAEATDVVSNAVAGKRISVRVTGTIDDRTAVATSAETGAVVGVLSPSKPRITGKTKVGKKLKVKAGPWGPGEVKLSYQWLRNGKVIKRATGRSYRLTKKDKGKRIQVRVTGKKGDFATAKVTSAKSKKVKR